MKRETKPASAAKAAAFAAMLRVLIDPLGNWVDDYRPVVWVVAVVLQELRKRPVVVTVEMH